MSCWEMTALGEFLRHDQLQVGSVEAAVGRSGSDGGYRADRVGRGGDGRDLEDDGVGTADVLRGPGSPVLEVGLGQNLPACLNR